MEAAALGASRAAQRPHPLVAGRAERRASSATRLALLPLPGRDGRRIAIRGPTRGVRHRWRVDPWEGPNVSRALSLVPAANELFMQNVSSMYVGRGGGFNDMVWDGPMSRPQAELLAARVSSINECFY